MGHASVNNIVEEMAKTTGELVATISEQHAKQVETLMKSTNAALEKLTAAILANKPASAAPANGNKTGNTKAARDAARAAAWAEKKKVATTCPHCNHVHPNRTHSQCWELPANASKRPANWTSVKST